MAVVGVLGASGEAGRHVARLLATPQTWGPTVTGVQPEGGEG